MKKYLVILFCLAGLAMSRDASAISFDLTSDHCTPTAAHPEGCGADGTVFGTVGLLQNGTTVDLTVHLNSPYAFAKTGAADDQAFKFNATGVTLTDITVDVHIPALVAATGSFNGDGTGNFSFGIICPTCGGGGSSSFTNDILFHVANATIADLTTTPLPLNGNGNYFVADVINTATGLTGPVDASNGVPDGGSTVTLLGSVLLGLAVLRRRFGKN